jgi:hypothetical protein
MDLFSGATGRASDRPASPRRRAVGAAALTRGMRRARRKFLGYYPNGFRDADYLDLERGYKWDAHKRWVAVLGEDAFRSRLRQKAWGDIAAAAVSIESRTNLLFSFEKMALRDAVKSAAGARAFAEGLFDLLHGDGSGEERFAAWCDVVAALPRKQTRVLTWPVVTVWGFLAQPGTHFYLKPTVTRRAFDALGLDFEYRSRPNWKVYSSLLTLARSVKRDVSDLGARDMIDIQSFLWVQGSDEYPG